MITLCPICGCSNYTLFKKINSGNFDQSQLYSQLRIMCCDSCFHFFNQLNDEQMINLAKYYVKEYIECHHNTVQKQSDVLKISKYDGIQLYVNVINYFNSPELTPTLGINRKYKRIILQQLIEHAINPRKVLTTISQFLTDDGILQIDCPDVSGYGDVSTVNGVICYSRPDKAGGYVNRTCVPANILLVDEYYFLMRQHVQHFDLEHLKLLANICGFDVVEQKKYKLEIIKNVYMPTVSVTLMKKNKLSPSNNVRYDKVKDTGYYCYGISREFLFLYQNGHYDGVIGFIDNNPGKLNMSINGMKIFPQEIIKNLPTGTKILITAYAHKKLMANKAKILNPNVQIIEDNR